ncbi:dual specificity protein phosphatase CDC14A-like [Venturia canescens]|uniref:dual specificity protein phosphatase CDC14A-like n=1 Tax=Venturia canescens TaxID=32260 RepID=UPI001C9CBE02|nr:dual specificity protein phosphatase CDC14A-like [Venturia canescens]
MEAAGSSLVHNHPDINCVAECIKNKFYFATLNNDRREPKSTSDLHLFNVDNELVYNNFYNDFGPLNLACLYKYCCKVNKKLRNPGNKHKQIVHCTSGQNHQKKANAAYLFTSYAIIYLKRNPRDVYANLIEAIKQPLKPFQDASMGVSMYNIRLQDCLNAIHKAAAFGFFNFDDFDLAEYEKYERMRYGDINWMIPQKFLAFTGPSTEIGTAYHPPEHYIDYFTKNDVIAVVRLNRKSYESSRFTRAGIAHYDMFMPDGSAPPRNILNQFLHLAETTVGPIAVHCKAGLGRTGSLIAAYIVKHYRMTAREAIAWLRICRPGSVIGHQQTWLEAMENELWRTGQQYRLKHHGDGDIILRHKRGIYSIAEKFEKREKKLCEKDSGNLNFIDKND